MEGKPFWMSKTLWVNALAIAGSLLIGQYVTADQWAEITAVGLAVVNIVLRFVTGEPVSWSKSE